MSAHIIDGRAVARAMQKELIKQVSTCVRTAGTAPAIAVIQVGADESTTMYARQQEKVASSLGIIYRLISLDAATADEVLAAKIAELNNDNSVSGILVQHPLPEHICPKKIPHLIDPAKDIEGIHPENIGHTVFDRSMVGSCTALAVMRLIEETAVELHGKEAVIVGHSKVVGRPVSWLLLDRLATVTVCHVATSRRGHLEEHVRRAEILVVAVGKPGVIKGEWISDGAVVIDVGINVVGDGVVGDVAFEEAAKRAGFITPVPGGVGPVTVMVLMRNAVRLFARQKGIIME